MNTVATTTWWLQMKSKPLYVPEELPEKCGVGLLKYPGNDYYLSLYKAVGGDYNWVDRTLLSKEELEKILMSENTEIYILTCNDEPAGFVEFNLTNQQETEIVYFGIGNVFRGRKLGLPFLQWAIHKAWERKITRLWLHTCDLDHKAALPLYMKVGFEIYHQEVVFQPIL